MHYGRSAEMGTKKLHSVSSEAVMVESTAVIHRENLTVGSILAQKEEYVWIHACVCEKQVLVC